MQAYLHADQAVDPSNIESLSQALDDDKPCGGLWTSTWLGEREGSATRFASRGTASTNVVGPPILW